eukprot:5638695-Prymnesium_polylepis.1
MSSAPEAFAAFASCAPCAHGTQRRMAGAAGGPRSTEVRRSVVSHPVCQSPTCSCIRRDDGA